MYNSNVPCAKLSTTAAETIHTFELYFKQNLYRNRKIIQEKSPIGFDKRYSYQFAKLPIILGADSFLNTSIMCNDRVFQHSRVSEIILSGDGKGSVEFLKLVSLESIDTSHATPTLSENQSGKLQSF